MKSKPTKFSITADGHKVRPGDRVYVTTDGDPFEIKTIGVCYSRKIAYLDPDPNDYTGAKLTAVFKNIPEL